jgi:hypothetical protein
MYDKLPTTSYITPQGIIEVADITTRFKVLQTVIDQGQYPLDISIPETDRPEVFADRVYGDAKKHWLILDLNNITNPFYDWVLPPESFDNYMDEKYPGYSLFLTNIDGDKGFTGSFLRNAVVFPTESTLASEQPSITDQYRFARVSSYDASQCKLVVEPTNESLWIPQVGEYIAGANLDALGVTHYYVGKIAKVQESPYALHHFEDSNRNILNPLLPYALQNKYFDSSAETGFTFGATLLGKYIFESETDYLIINRDHEIEENESNRFVTIVSKTFLTDVEEVIAEKLNVQ